MRLCSTANGGNMRFKKILNIILRHNVDRPTAENIAQDILGYHPCGDCAYYGECNTHYEDCIYSDREIYSSEEMYSYSEYVINWYKTHNEGTPVCIDDTIIEDDLKEIK